MPPKTPPETAVAVKQFIYTVAHQFAWDTRNPGILPLNAVFNNGAAEFLDTGRFSLLPALYRVSCVVQYDASECSRLRVALFNQSSSLDLSVAENVPVPSAPGNLFVQGYVTPLYPSHAHYVYVESIGGRLAAALTTFTLEVVE